MWRVPVEPTSRGPQSRGRSPAFLETPFGHLVRGGTPRVAGDWRHWNLPPRPRRHGSAFLYQAPELPRGIGDGHVPGDRPTAIRHLNHLSVAHAIDHLRCVLVQFPDADLLHDAIVGQVLLHSWKSCTERDPEMKAPPASAGGAELLPLELLGQREDDARLE